MAVDESFVGRALPSPPYLVGREKIREFASAIGDDSPLCHDVEAARAAGHPDLVAPPTFSAVFTTPAMFGLLTDPAFGWDFSRMVHGDQSFTLHRPIHAGDELMATVHVDELRTRAGSHLLSLRCEVSAAVGGEAVLTTRSLLVTMAGE